MAKENKVLRIIGAVSLIVLLLIFLLMMVFGQAPDSIEPNDVETFILHYAGKATWV